MQTFVEDGFYIWLYERPVSPWAYVWTALIPRARRLPAASGLRASACLVTGFGCDWLCPCISGTIQLPQLAPCLMHASTQGARHASYARHPLPCTPCPPAAVAVVGCCLFPLAPNWTKVAVFYATAGLLALILGVLALRRLVGGAVLC